MRSRRNTLAQSNSAVWVGFAFLKNSSSISYFE
jgi:hypothetical protein